MTRIEYGLRRLIEWLTVDQRIDAGHGPRCSCAPCEDTREHLNAW